MRNNVVFYLSLLTLITIGAWGLSTVAFDSDNSKTQARAKTATQSQKEVAPTTLVTRKVSQQIAKNNRFLNILTELRNGDVRQAAFAINDSYSALSSDELEQLKLEFIRQAANSNANTKTQILLAASKAFDNLEVWKPLSLAAEKSGDWKLAFDAQLRSSQLENDPIELDILLKRLVQSSSHMRAGFEKTGDQLSVKTLYQNLSDLHPHFSRFQLELAHAHARLGDSQAAKPIYDALSYDLEFGDIAQNALARLTESEDQQSAAITEDQTLESSRTSDIIVPLIPVGSSFLVETRIDRQPSRLLLDTGASITSLSSKLIARLDLRPTGQSIRLSTANGVTSARLYRANSLSFGQLTLKNMLIAEIDLGRQSQFEGLLGTDALNQLKSQYSYVIDNQKNALIFRAR